MHCFCCSLGEGEPTEDRGREVETFPLSHDALLLLSIPLSFLSCCICCVRHHVSLLPKFSCSTYDGQLREMLRMLASQVMTNDPSGSADGALQWRGQWTHASGVFILAYVIIRDTQCNIWTIETKPYNPSDQPCRQPFSSHFFFQFSLAIFHTSIYAQGERDVCT